MGFEMLPSEKGPIIKVIGIGGAGGNIVNTMIRQKQSVKSVEFIVANTDRQALSRSEAENKIELGRTGLGAGGRPEVGQAAANEAREEIANYLNGASMVFITAGMGGGTGTGAAPIVAEVAQELDILTVAIVTKPFSFEGSRRMKNAEAGLKELKTKVHSMIVILNDKLDEGREEATLKECFERADKVLYDACFGIAEVIEARGLVNLDFEDVRSVMSERGTALMGAGEAEGEDRAIKAAEAAVSSPLLEGAGIKGAKGVLVNISGPSTVQTSEIKGAVEMIRNLADPDANVIFGFVPDKEIGDKIRVTVIATGLDQENEPEPPKDPPWWTPEPQPPKAAKNEGVADLFNNPPVEPEPNVEENEQEDPQLIPDPGPEIIEEPIYPPKTGKAAQKKKPVQPEQPRGVTRGKEASDDENMFVGRPVRPTRNGAARNDQNSSWPFAGYFSGGENTKNNQEQEEDEIMDFGKQVPAFLRKKKR